MVRARGDVTEVVSDVALREYDIACDAFDLKHAVGHRLELIVVARLEEVHLQSALLEEVGERVCPREVMGGDGRCVCP